MNLLSCVLPRTILCAAWTNQLRHPRPQVADHSLECRQVRHQRAKPLLPGLLDEGKYTVVEEFVRACEGDAPDVALLTKQPPSMPSSHRSHPPTAHRVISGHSRIAADARSSASAIGKMRQRLLPTVSRRSTGRSAGSMPLKPREHPPHSASTTAAGMVPIESWMSLQAACRPPPGPGAARRYRNRPMRCGTAFGRVAGRRGSCRRTPEP